MYLRLAKDGESDPEEEEAPVQLGLRDVEAALRLDALCATALALRAKLLPLQGLDGLGEEQQWARRVAEDSFAGGSPISESSILGTYDSLCFSFPVGWRGGHVAGHCGGRSGQGCQQAGSQGGLLAEAIE